MIGTYAHRQVITFYSFKGGVGRTMTLANVAYRLAFHHGLHVIAVDWDLEAPGLQSFFQLPGKTKQKPRGLLDYCEDWETAYRAQAAEIPDPLSYLVPADPGTKEETRGSLRLLIAGKQDEEYDARLGRFDWKRFYAESAGAGAVEHLRNSLAEDADVVLIDSRTGLTDPGGICTIQIPDAVVLMTAPNKQSLDGIERIAQSIATAAPEARAGRGTARVFLCMSRVPMVEESYQAREWFKTNEPWFNKGVEAGLWRREDHALGFETHVIPQRGTYGFDESLVGRAVGTLEREPLAQAYDKLTRVLLQWKWENVWQVNRQSETDQATKLAETKKEVARARKRGNAVDLIYALANRAQALSGAEKWDEALVVALEAVVLAEKQQNPSLLGMSYFVQSSALFNLRQFAAARDACQMSLMHAERVQEPTMIALVRAQLGNTLVKLGQAQEGKLLALDAIADLRAQGKLDVAGKTLAFFNSTQVLEDVQREIISQKRLTIVLTRILGDAKGEVAEIRKLLELTEEHNVKLPDEAELRKRLEELETPPQLPASLVPAKPKRSRAKR